MSFCLAAGCLGNSGIHFVDESWSDVNDFSAPIGEEKDLSQTSGKFHIHLYLVDPNDRDLSPIGTEYFQIMTKCAICAHSQISTVRPPSTTAMTQSAPSNLHMLYKRLKLQPTYFNPSYRRTKRKPSSPPTLNLTRATQTHLTIRTSQFPSNLRFTALRQDQLGISRFSWEHFGPRMIAVLR